MYRQTMPVPPFGLEVFEIFHLEVLRVPKDRAYLCLKDLPESPVVYFQVFAFEEKAEVCGCGWAGSETDFCF